MRRTAPTLLITAVVSLGATASTPPSAAAPERASTGDRHLSTGIHPKDIELPPHSFYFTRAAYRSGAWGGRGRGRRGRPCGSQHWPELGRSWQTDCPEADEHFGRVIRRVTNLDAYTEGNAVKLDDPALRRFPFLYAVEVGRMSLSDSEVAGLRDFLLAGGFLMVDDFWGGREWARFEDNIGRVLPDHSIEELPRDHPVFSAYYRIDEILQVPNVYNAQRGYTSECGGCEPQVLGIHDETGRLMVVINWNTDLGDAWEWADSPWYPLVYSTFAYELGVNFIVYAMSH